MHTQITIQASIKAPLATVWERYTKPKHIVQWNHASDEWHSPKAENDLREGGRFNYRMEAKDGSFGFDFEGTYTEVIPQERIAYVMEDGREVEITFEEGEEECKLRIRFDAESENSIEMQRDGWQAILNNFKKCAEATD